MTADNFLSLLSSIVAYVKSVAVSKTSVFWFRDFPDYIKNTTISGATVEGLFPRELMLLIWGGGGEGQNKYDKIPHTVLS